MTVTLGDRLGALEQILDHGERHGLFDSHGGPSLHELTDTLNRSQARLGHGSAHTVVALAGATGSGKSSLFNALAGDAIASVGVRRPTTADAEALVVGTEDAGELLEWLGVHHRHHLVDGTTTGLESGLVLIDLPDHDSVERANRAEVDRLVGLVDMFVWVADPQKYGDESLHAGYLKRLSGHSDVMLFVLSKTDLLTDDAAAQCRADFGRLVAADGIPDPRVIGVSTYNGEGMDELRGALSAAVETRAAAVLRTEADLRQVGQQLAQASETRAIDHAGHADTLVVDLADAIDADRAAAVIGAQHRHRGRAALDWPVTKWVNKWRRSPAKDLPTAANLATLRPQVSSALRDYGDARTADLPAAWQRAGRSRLSDSEPALIEQLGGVASRALREGSDRPGWWSWGAGIQWLLTAVAAVAGLWLIALFVVETFLQIEVAALTPNVRGVPLPTWLLLGALLTGAVLTLVFRGCLAVAARRRERRGRAAIRREVHGVAEPLIGTVDLHREDADAYREMTLILIG